jgi:outer membrane immunogenic protein
MKKLLVTTVAIGIMAGCSAYAADMSVPAYKAPVAVAAPTWTGCYVGGNLGWGWGQTNFTDASRDNLLFDGSPDGGFIDAEELQRTVGLSSSGVMFGGQVGCDYQFGSNFVIGISGSAAGADINSGTANANPFSDAGTIQSAKTDFLADISGRLGFTYGQALFYGKGGVAWAHNQYAMGFEDDGGILTANNTITGAVAGGGIEWAFAPNWSAFAEYDHYFFRPQAVNFSGVQDEGSDTVSALVNVKQSIDTVKLGVNYRFGWGYH